MTTVGAVIEISQRDVETIVGRMIDAVRPSQRLLDSIGSLLAGSAVERIDDTNRGPDGTAWPEWSKDYADWRAARGGEQTKLRLLGHLQQSITWNVGSDQVEVGASAEHAAVHQFGYKGIPARPYLGISDRDGERILQRVTRAIAEQIGGTT